MLLSVSLAFSSENNSYIPQNENPFNEKWRWHTYPELVGKGCRSMAEEKNGNLWFGVSGGVFRYDGLSWEFFSLDGDSSGIMIVSLFVSSQGIIYAGSTKGIFRFVMGKWGKIDLNLDFGDQIVYPYNKIPMIESSDHSIWIGSKQGAIRIKNGKTILYRKETIFTDIKYDNKKIKKNNLFDIYSISEDHNGNLWFGLRDGEIYKCILNDYSLASIPTWIRIDTERNYTKFKYPLIELASNGFVYIASGENDGGLNIHDGKKWRHLKLKDKYQIDDIFSSIIELQNGKICIGGIGRIYIGEMFDWKMYESHTLPFASNRLVLYQSSNQNLWIIGLSNEVWKIDLSTQNWETFLGLNFQTEDNNHNYWFITFEGKIISYNTVSKKWSKFNISNGVIDSPLIIFTTKQGQIWTAGSHERISATAFFDGTKWIKQILPHLGWSIDRRAAFESLDGSLWFGSSSDIIVERGQKGGLVRYLNPKNIKINDVQIEYHYPNENLRLTGVYGIGQTNDSLIWTGQLGLYNYNQNKKKWTKNIEPMGLRESFIDCIDTAPNGDVWAGTRTEGVYWFNSENKKWHRFTTMDGLSSNTIVFIYAENKSNIWVVTDKDISHFDGKSWTKGVFSDYFRSDRDGITMHRTKDGSLWINQNPPIWYRRSLYNEKISPDLRNDFRTIRHYPDKISPETTVTFFQERISQPGNVILSWVGNDPWKSTSGSQLKFSYRIDADEWSEFKDKTNDIFLALSEGNHTFQVRSRDADFNIDPTPAYIKFYVVPPVWLQTWFILLIFTFLTTIIIFMIYLYHRNKIIKEISETKVRLFANISHELRTPLTLILGPIAKVLESPLLSFELREPLNRINRNTHRLLRLVNQVLDFRKMEAGQLKFKPKNGDIIEFLKEEVFVFQEAVKSKNISLTFESYINQLNLWFDPDKIEKIMFNILSNALKFTASNGCINVKVSEIQTEKTLTIVLSKQKNIKFEKWLKININDTGIGIPKRNIEKIFERFYQAQENNKTTVGGTGIGLSVVKEMVQVHFGKISVESLEGKGTTFTILIPLIEERMIEGILGESKINISEHINIKYPERMDDEKLISIVDNKNIGKDKDKILVVEDNADMREYLKEELQNEFTILEACNGNQGFEVAINESPELILSDIMMPNINGIEFCKEIKTDERTSHIAVILLTARSSRESKIEGLETGADDYLTKPFYIDELRLRINNIIESRRKFREQFGKSLDLKPSNIHITSVDQKFIKNAINIIEENIDDPEFSVEKFSHLIGKSRVALYNKLKALTDNSVQEFIFVIKLKRAAQLLRESGKSVTEIAYDVGFKDPSHFSKLFKKHYGLSPKAYINEYNKNKV